MLSLGIASNSVAGVVAFYSIIHIARDQMITALSEIHRVLRPGGSLLLAFHLGTEIIHESDLWGYPVDFDATLFTTDEMILYLNAARMEVEQAIERDPYPEVEYQSRRGYILATKP